MLYPSFLPWTSDGKQHFTSSFGNSARSFPSKSQGTFMEGIASECWDRVIQMGPSRSWVNQGTTQSYGFQGSTHTQPQHINTHALVLTTLDIVRLNDQSINQSINQSSVYQSYLVHKKLLWPVPLPNSDSPTHFFGFHEKISMPVSLPKSTSPVKCKAYLINMPWRYKGGVEV